MQSQLAAIWRQMKITWWRCRRFSPQHRQYPVASLLPLMGPSDPTFIIQICYTADQLMTQKSPADQRSAR